MTAVGTSISNIQSAVVAKLRADDGFRSLTAGLGIFDMSAILQTGQPLPYVTIGNPIETQKDTMGTVSARGYDTQFLLHIWTQERGFLTAHKILMKINTIIHRQPLALENSQTVAGVWYLNSNSMLDPDGVTQHIAARYRFFVQEDL